MHKFDLKNRTAVVTGGAQGFGLDIAKRFLDSGAKVYIWDIDEKLLKSVIDEIKNPNLEFNVVDVADYKSARRWIAFLVYLNDNFSGGETEFYPHQQVIHPKTGRVLVFPCVWTYPHAGLPITTGTKYILTTYFHYI